MKRFKNLGWIVLWLGALGGCETTLEADEGAISCSNRRDDWWRISVSGTSTVALSVDTISPSTAFDPSIEIYEVDAWSTDVNAIVRGTYVGGTDDDFECTFPPPSFECPSETVTASADFLVVVENLGNCAGSVGQYRLQAVGADFITYLGQEPN